MGTDSGRFGRLTSRSIAPSFSYTRERLANALLGLAHRGPCRRIPSAARCAGPSAADSARPRSRAPARSTLVESFGSKPAIAREHQRRIFGARGDHAALIEARGERDHAVARHAAVRGLDARHTAQRGGLANRAAGVRGRGQRARAARPPQPRSRPRSRPAPCAVFQGLRTGPK